jgi:hypothetical protein
MLVIHRKGFPSRCSKNKARSFQRTLTYYRPHHFLNEYQAPVNDIYKGHNSQQPKQQRHLQKDFAVCVVCESGQTFLFTSPKTFTVRIRKDYLDSFDSNKNTIFYTLTMSTLTIRRDLE